jgi:type IV pilus assembly protein PilX
MDNCKHPVKKALTRTYGKPLAQQGIVLIVSLIMLLLLTLIGTTGMQTTSLEEKMAGNMRDRNLAFQAAESALTAGEQYLVNVAIFPTPFCTSTDGRANGRYKPMDKDCNGVTDLDANNKPIQLWDNTVWDSGASVALTGAMSNLSANPRYIIEDMSCPTPPCAAGTHSYRVTARASGGSADTVVILQSIYRI